MKKNFNELPMEEKEKLWKAITQIHELFGVKSPDFIIQLLKHGVYELSDTGYIGLDCYNECITAVAVLYDLAEFCGYKMNY